MQRLLPFLLLAAAAVGQVSLSGGVKITGGTTLGGTLINTFWTPGILINNALYTNSPNCYATSQNCAPALGTTSNQSLFAGMSETRFVASASRDGSGTGTITIPSGQGCCGGTGTYNFSTTDHVTLTTCGVLNGNYAVTAKSTTALTVSIAGSATSVSGCTAYRSNPSQDDRYIPAPGNMANYVDDGVDIHDLIYGNGGYAAGSGDSVIVFYHLVPFQHCPAGTCVFSAKPNQTTNGSHVMVGYKASSSSEVTAQIAAMKRLSKSTAKSGMIFDWAGGPISGQSATRAEENGVLDTWASQLAGQSSFLFAAALDNSAWTTSAACGSSIATQTPSCVEKVMENAMAYAKTATASTYTSPFDGLSHNGGGYFASSAYWHDPDTGQPVVMAWFNGESSWFTSCASGCAVYNAGVAGVTCTSSSDCWTKVKQGVANYVSGWSTSLKPEWFWRNTFSNNSIINAGAFSWQNPSTSATNMGYVDSDITTAATSTKKFIASATKGLNHAQSSFQDDALIIGTRCGQTWLDWMKRTSTAGTGNLFGPGHKALWAIQIATWNDHEQGTTLEPGINNCYSISASLSTTTVSWSLSTRDATYAPLPLNTSTNDTLDHIALLAVKTGGTTGSGDAQVIATAAPGSSGTFDLSSISLDSGIYTLYVKLVPRAGIQTSVSASMSFTK